MAINRKLITMSLYEDDLKTLDWIAAEVGLGRSETVRRLIQKAYLDKTTRSIIKSGFKPTLNNAHSDNNEKNEKPGDQTGPESPTKDSMKSITRSQALAMGISPEWSEDIERTIEIAKTRWIDED